MSHHAISTDTGYRETLKEIEALMSAGPDTSEGLRLEALVKMVEDYERKFFHL
jgi:HTH-type transcriptional regulator/antitoxin HigA